MYAIRSYYALQELGGKCVFSSEFNYHAQRAYEFNFGEVPFGDT